MKKFYFFVTFLAINYIAMAQRPIRPVSSLLYEATGIDSIYVVPNNAFPSPSIGYDSAHAFIKQYIETRVKDNEIKGTVILEFIVEKDSTITNIRTVSGRGLGLYADSLAISAVSSIGKWNPGIQDSVPVRVYNRFTVRFENDKGTGSYDEREMSSMRILDLETITDIPLE